MTKVPQMIAVPDAWHTFCHPILPTSFWISPSAGSPFPPRCETEVPRRPSRAILCSCGKFYLTRVPAGLDRAASARGELKP